MPPIAIEILPVSSETISEIQSVSSEIPNAALCLVPNLLLIFKLSLVGKTAPALVILSPWIITPPSCNGLLGKKIEISKSLDISAYIFFYFSIYSSKLLSLSITIKAPILIFFK